MEDGRLRTKGGILLWGVCLRDRVTNEKLHIKVPAKTNEEATASVTVLFGSDGPYIWLGTGPLYVGNKGLAESN